MAEIDKSLREDQLEDESYKKPQVFERGKLTRVTKDSVCGDVPEAENETVLWGTPARSF